MRRSTILDNKLVRGVLAAAFWLAVWALAARLVGLQLLLPGPAAAVRALCRSARQTAFWREVMASVVRIFAGFLCGTLVGALLGAATSWSRVLNLLFAPAVGVVRAIPVVSFIILALLWLPSTVLPLFIAALMVLPVVWKNVTEGVRQTDRQLLEMAQVYRFGRWKTLRHVYAPSVAPYFRSACITALGLAWKAGVAAEVICQPKLAIGTELYRAKVYFETPDLFAWTLVVILLSFLLEKGLAWLLRGRERK